MITLEEEIMIKHLHNQGLTQASISRELGLDPKTVHRAISKDNNDGHKTKQSRGSILDPYREYIKQRLDKYDLTATRILREIQDQGYTGSYTILKRYVREVKGAKPKPAFVRFETEPGEQAQVDWSDFGWIDSNGKRLKLYCFSMVLGYSRTLYIEFTYSQNSVCLGKAHINAFRYFGGFTDTILYDNMTTVVLSREGENIQWNPQYADFARYYGFIPKLCQPGRKETKGKVERPFSYIRTSFFDGSDFNGLTDLNEKAHNWLDNVANIRIHATTKMIPFDRLKEENLHPLKDVDYLLEHSETRKSSKDCYISFEGNRYSIPYQHSCRDLIVKLTGDHQEEKLQIFHGQELIAVHKMSYQKGQMITDPQHFKGIPRPAYPSGVRAIREMFLAHFPTGNPFLDGLVKAKYGNARYHILQVLNLLEDYPKDRIASAIERATFYGAYGCSAIRNICRQGEIPVPMLQEIELTEKKPVVSEPVQERPLNYYSQMKS